MRQLGDNPRIRQILARLEALTPWMTRNADQPTFDCPICLDGEGFATRTDKAGAVWSHYCNCAHGHQLREANERRKLDEQNRRKVKAARMAAAADPDEGLPF